MLIIRTLRDEGERERKYRGMVEHELAVIHIYRGRTEKREEGEEDKEGAGDKGNGR